MGSPHRSFSLLRGWLQSLSTTYRDRAAHFCLTTAYWCAENAPFLGSWFIHQVSEGSQEGLRGTAYLHKCLWSQIYEPDYSTSPKVWLMNFSFPIKEGTDLIPQVGQPGGERYTLPKGLVVCPCSSLTLAWKDLQCRGNTITGQPSVSIQLGAGFHLLNDPQLFSAHPNTSLDYGVTRQANACAGGHATQTCCSQEQNSN